MAKHPHKLMLMQGRTWRCVLDGCAFFVHLGLAQIIVGKRIICWKCEDTFLVEHELPLNEPRPICPMCAGTSLHIPSDSDIDEYIKQQKEKKSVEPDKIEDEIAHTEWCSYWTTGECDCTT